MSHTPAPSFKVGDRIRMKPVTRRLPHNATRTAVVIRADRYFPRYRRDDGSLCGGYWWYRVRKDGRKGLTDIRGDEWELETDPVILRDHVADLLIQAYQDGDKTALRPLIDRLLELLG